MAFQVPEHLRIRTGDLGSSTNDGNNGAFSFRTGFLTLNTLEFPSAAVVCSLSDILETGVVPLRYFLSAKACRGILRRAERRGKTLPQPLARAVQAVAASEEISTTTED